jgi:plastocyanin
LGELVETSEREQARRFLPLRLPRQSALPVHRLSDLSRRGQLVALILASLLVLPPLVAFFQFLPVWRPTGDNAFIALRTLDVGTYYVRAHIAIGGDDHWSEEFQVNVVPEVEDLGAVSADHTVNISTSVPPCQGDVFSPNERQVSVGESVRWRNQAACGHTATSGATHGSHDDHFDTGNIATNGAFSNAYRFNKPGEYTYYCAFHSGMPLAKIVVSA